VRPQKYLPFLVMMAGVCLAIIFYNSRPAIGEVLCGQGSLSDNYGFSYSLQQPHWTVDWEPYLSVETVNEIDAVLDQLNNDNIAQTMILFKTTGEVGDRVNCVVHFLRYMKLGQSEGGRKDNGFAFLIVVEDGSIDVHYGVGLGLPALTAQGLTPLNRLAESTFQSTGSMDKALLALVHEFDTYARSKYQPAQAPIPTPMTIPISAPTTPLGYCLCCLGLIIILVVLFVIFRFIARATRGGWLPPGGGGGWNSGGWRPPSGGFKMPTFRGGGGSGRANRGN
jgi:hypothetical protein